MKMIDVVKLRIILINYKAYGVDVDKTVNDICSLFEKDNSEVKKMKDIVVVDGEMWTVEKWRDAMENLREAVEDVPGAVEVIKEAALSAKKTADAAYEVVIELQGDYHNFKGEMSRRLDELEKRKTLLQRLVEWLVGLR